MNERFNERYNVLYARNLNQDNHKFLFLEISKEVRENRRKHFMFPFLLFNFLSFLSRQ